MHCRTPLFVPPTRTSPYFPSLAPILHTISEHTIQSIQIYNYQKHNLCRTQIHITFTLSQYKLRYSVWLLLVVHIKDP